jgi:SpoU rRNA methylase family enzyme
MISCHLRLKDVVGIAQSGIVRVLSQSTDTERELLFLRDIENSLDIALKFWHDLCIDDVADGHTGIEILEIQLVL